MLVEPGDIDVRTMRLPDRLAPFRAKAGHMGLRRGGGQALEPRAAIREPCLERIEFRAVFAAPDIKRPARAQETAIAQVSLRRAAQRHDFGTAVAFLPESRRTPGGMITRHLLRFEEEDTQVTAHLGRKARACHPGTDNR